MATIFYSLYQQTMNYYPYHPSYYRSHHYAHQNNLPDSAMNNRKMPTYTSEMPQGMHSFLPSHKKHFQRVGYRSVITEQQIINHQGGQQHQSPAKNKEYYRNLSISDIQGATPNTLISKALRNRIKAKQLLLKKHQNERSQQNLTPDHLSITPKHYDRIQASNIIKQYKMQQNYHNKNRPYKIQQKTQPKQALDQGQNNKIDEFKNYIYQTQIQIKQLEKRLNEARDKIEKQKSQNEESNLQNKRLPSKNSINSNQLKMLILPKISYHQQQKYDNTQQLKFSAKSGRKKSYTQPNQTQSYNYPQRDKVVQSQPQNTHLQKLDQSRIRRQQIRKMNPTHLSYGSNSLLNNPRRIYL